MAKWYTDGKMDDKGDKDEIGENEIKKINNFG